MANDLVFIIMDSCRYDSLVAATAPNIAHFGEAEKRFAYASWTSPSHFTLLMGMLPHTSPPGVFASEVYKGEFGKWGDRLGIDDLSFKTFVPFLSLPKVLKDNGYHTVGRVSLPVLNPYSGMSRHFDDYKLMSDHNDFAGMVDEIEFSAGQPSFYFLNLGETHYPYMLEPKSVPHISGVHGVFKRMGDSTSSIAQGDTDAFFDVEQMQSFHRQQTRCVEHVDGVLEALVSKAPVGTHFIITADHGECFGEGGFFGHGPILHDKVFEVPFLEGKKR